MKRPRVLVIEDDAAIRRGIVDALEFHKYGAIEAANGADGLTAALTADYQLLLLDLVLPGRDGLDILKALRAARPAIPVIVITARGAEPDRICGLKLGADDYVVKPFSVRELMARVQAVLRRATPVEHDAGRIAFAGGWADPESGEVHLHQGELEHLSAREAALLRYLAGHAGRTVTREELLARAWGLNNAEALETRTVDMHVARLREKLGDDREQPRIIATERGKGYRFLPAPRASR